MGGFLTSLEVCIILPSSCKQSKMIRKALDKITLKKKKTTLKQFMMFSSLLGKRSMAYSHYLYDQFTSCLQFLLVGIVKMLNFPSEDMDAHCYDSHSSATKATLLYCTATQIQLYLKMKNIFKYFVPKKE